MKEKKNNIVGVAFCAVSSSARRAKAILRYPASADHLVNRGCELTFSAIYAPNFGDADVLNLSGKVESKMLVHTDTIELGDFFGTLANVIGASYIADADGVIKTTLEEISFNYEEVAQ